MTDRNSKKLIRIIPIRITLGGREKPKAVVPKAADPSVIAIGSVADMCGMSSADELRTFIVNEDLGLLMKNRGMLYRNGLFAVLAAVNASRRASNGGAK